MDDPQLKRLFENGQFTDAEDFRESIHLQHYQIKGNRVFCGITK